ncbi:MAG: hypothetical protein SCALA702_24970 [Melioribacteraceae bacterium]|nr:MAG: hypothetical protein SCALA702_24970 [Melioribacteraceae bacterium]
MNFSFTEIIELITGFQFAFLALFLFMNRRSEKYANRFLILFLIGKSITLLYRYTYKFLPPLPPEWHFLYYWGYPFLLFYSPFIYFYVRSLVEKEFRFEKFHLIHWTPFVLISLLIPVKYLFNYDATIEYIDKHGFVMNLTEMITVGFLYYLQAVSYTAVAINLIIKFRSRLKEKFSSYEKINMGWALLLLGGFMSVWVIFFSEFFLHAITGIFSPVIQYFHIAGVTGLFTFANMLAYRGLKFPEITAEENELKSGNSEGLDLKSEYIKLKNMMIMEKPFLDPNLTLLNLSRNIGLSQRNLSNVINKEAGENFYDFVNRFRIEEAKELLIEKKDKTILDIAFQSGFNSKSVFNTAFKKFTTITPSQYKKQKIETAA